MNTSEMVRFTNNYALIQNHESGDRWLVKHGQLEKVKGIRDRIRYFFYRTRIQRAVQREITWTVNQLKPNENGKFICRLEDGELRLTADKVHRLILQKLAPLDGTETDTNIVRHTHTERDTPHTHTQRNIDTH